MAPKPDLVLATAAVFAFAVAAGVAVGRAPAKSQARRAVCGPYGDVPRDQGAIVSRDRRTLAWSQQSPRPDRTGRVMVARPDASRSRPVAVPDRAYDWLEAISPEGDEVLITKDRFNPAAMLVVASTRQASARFVSRDEAIAIRRAWRTPEWSPDGSLRVEIDRDGVWVERADGTARRRLSSTGFAVEAAWSPDGHLIAFTADDVYNSLDELYVVRPDGTGLRQIGEDLGVEAIAWSPDSTRIAHEIDGSAYDEGVWIRVTTVATGSTSDLTDPDDPPDNRRAAEPAWLDAGTIVFTAYERRERYSHRVVVLHAIEADGTRERRLTYHCHLGWKGNDRGFGAFGDLQGSAFADVMLSFQGNDRVLADDGDDVVEAGPGNDYVDAGSGNDVVRGGPGNDILVADLPGGRDRDLVDCGPGRDVAVVGARGTVRACERVTRRR